MVDSNIGTRTIAGTTPLADYGLGTTVDSTINGLLTDDRLFSPEKLFARCKGCGLELPSVSHNERVGSQGRIILTGFADKKNTAFKSFVIHGYFLHDERKGYEGTCFQSGKDGVKIDLIPS